MKKSPFLSHFSLIFQLSIASAILSFILARLGFPDGYDLEFYTVMYESFKEQIIGGESYPRWMHDMYSGFGAPSFFLYPPLFFYAQYLIDAVTFWQFETSELMQLSCFFIIFASGLSFYYVGCRVTTPVISLVASLVYITLPNHLWYDIYERNGLAEAFAYVWIPLVLYSSMNVHKERKHILLFALSYCLLVLTHIPSAIITSFLASLVVLYTIARHGDWKERFDAGLSFAIAVVLGVGLSFIYLLPAVSMFGFVNGKEMLEGIYHYSEMFLTPYFDLHKTMPDLKLNLFYSTLALLIIQSSALFFSYKHMKEEKRTFLLFVLCASLFFFFMTTPLSVFLWDNFSIIQILQLPFRFLVSIDFLFVFSLLLIFGSSFRETPLAPDLFKFYLFFFTLVSFSSGFFFYMGVLAEHTPEYTRNRLEHDYPGFEYVPSNPSLSVDQKAFLELDERSFFINPNGYEASVITNTPREKEFRIDAKAQTSVQLRQFYFPGWSLIDMDTSLSLGEKYNLRDEAPYGQIAFDVPKGAHHLRLFMPLHPQEKFGIIVSLASLLLLAIGCLLLRHKKAQP